MASAHSLEHQAPAKTKINPHKKTAVTTIMITKTAFADKLNNAVAIAE